MLEASQPVNFVHLHNHTHYSLLDGLQKVPEMLDQVRNLGMSAVALTDHGSMSGAIEFYAEAKKRNIKPIIGFEAYVAPRSMDDRSGKTDANPYHLTLLAKDFQGYQNLMRLSTAAHLDGFYYKPRIDRRLIAKHAQGIIALSGCASGEVARHILNSDLKQAKQVAEWYQQIFGAENYFLELQDHEEWPTQKIINDGLLKLAKEINAPIVVTADSHYTHKSDREPHEILLCVQTGKTVGDTDRMEMEMDLYLTDPKDIAKRWSKVPGAIENTARIAEMCNVEIKLGQILLPSFDVPDGATQPDYLEKLAYQGLAWRYGGIPKEDIVHITKSKAISLVSKQLVERLDFELGVVNKMGFASYFLIVADFINWGKNQGIIFGPGRGSAAGSIVSYALNITDIDPIKYNLLFERFLNPERIEMPDIDVDMQDNRRQEVIDYVVGRYGQERVAQIMTFGTMAARAAIRDTGRALGMSYAEVDVIAKLVPMPIQGRHLGLAKTIVQDQQLKQEYNSNDRAKRLIDLAMRLEGTIRSNSVHAAGVVISPDEIVNYTPLARAQKGGISTQYDMGPIQDLGLLKMDLLGLSNLSIIKNALRIIKKVHNHAIDLAELPLDDSKTFALLAKGETTGVFQLESAGMKRYIKDLAPNQFEDIVAMVALYRPGPMQWIEDFIERKHGRREITYLHPAMKTALSGTYGIMIYQEQVMQIAVDLCGFSGSQADTLRKAIGKKIPSVMAKMKSEFIEGGIKTSGAGRSMMEKFWRNLEDFAAYCFNKSHAACYGMIAYQTAYLKAHYPAEYMAALMTSDHGNSDRISIEVAECARLGIEVLPPDVNQSFLEFGVVPGTKKIRFGLSAIKNVGQGAISAILAARDMGEAFTNVEDFASRVPATEVNKKVWESLAKSGAFDSLADRGVILGNIDTILGFAQKAQKNALSGQIDIFGLVGDSDDSPRLALPSPSQEIDLRTRLSWEKELLGLYISHHPLDSYLEKLQNLAYPISGLVPNMEGRNVKVGGIITIAKRIVTKSGTQMAFVSVEDKSGTIEIIVFPKLLEAHQGLWQVDQIVIISGRLTHKDRDGKSTGELKIIAESIRSLDEEAVVATPAPRIDIKAAPGQMQATKVVTTSQKALVISGADLSDTGMLVKIKQALLSSPGEQEVFLITAGPKKIRLPFKVTVTEELIEQLRVVAGAGSIKLST